MQMIASALVPTVLFETVSLLVGVSQLAGTFTRQPNLIYYSILFECGGGYIGGGGWPLDPTGTPPVRGKRSAAGSKTQTRPIPEKHYGNH